MTKEQEFIKHMGESIFPQPFKELDKLFDMETMVSCAKKGFIQESQAMVGASPSRMKQVRKYVDLTDLGWEEYEKIRQ